MSFYDRDPFKGVGKIAVVAILGYLAFLTAIILIIAAVLHYVLGVG